MSLNIEHRAVVIIEEVKVVCCTFTDGIVVEVWFAFVARESVKRGSTFTLAGLLITGHAIGAMNIAVACYRNTQTHDTTEHTTPHTHSHWLAVLYSNCAHTHTR